MSRNTWRSGAAASEQYNTVILVFDRVQRIAYKLSRQSSTAVRLSNIVYCFNREGDVVQWIKKLEFVAVNYGCSKFYLILGMPAFAVFRDGCG